MIYRPVLAGTLLALVLFVRAVPAMAAEEKPAADDTPTLSEEDRQVVEMMDLLEVLELLNEMDSVTALEDEQ